ncbi:MAG: 4-hydroxythreonine-4-phosphate dehydrogenase PdxA [Deltaproteobacteria bacterium]|nr:4-hydroxythreonine-4-phosphate dehydrogenase PdxA [Deltaproteobacteria bacterium]
MALPRVAISLGDPSGIGPEVTARALAMPAIRRALIPIVFGDERIWAAACRLTGAADRLARVDSADQARGPSLVRVTRLALREARPGRPSAAGGRAQLAFLERALDALEEEAADALCTAPVSKEGIARAGIAFTGHTELLAERFRARVLMLLAGPKLRVAVHTTHLALADVPRKISRRGIIEDLKVLDRGLREGFGVRRPRLAVCGLNPHAGDGGLFGDEESRIIAPAIRAARAAGIDATGPYPADGVIPKAAQGAFDAVLAMYHDQGLVALKLLHFDDGVNVTLGLPKPRTSPDHGVAYDLAGSGRARPDSMRAALTLAAHLAGTKVP